MTPEAYTTSPSTSDERLAASNRDLLFVDPPASGLLATAAIESEIAIPRTASPFLPYGSLRESWWTLQVSSGPCTHSNPDTLFLISIKRKMYRSPDGRLSSL